MGVFDPNDFEGQPYVGGLNQMGHFIFGAALVGWANYCITSDVWYSLAIACVVFGSWELYQRLFKGATRSDFIIDIVYWAIGAVVWSGCIMYQKVSEEGIIFPTIPLCVWVLEFTRLRANE